MQEITVTFTVSDSNTMRRLTRFLAWLNFNSHWGHSALGAMSLDGDGSEKVYVSGVDIMPYAKYVHDLRGRKVDAPIELITDGSNE